MRDEKEKKEKKKEEKKERKRKSPMFVYLIRSTVRQNSERSNDDNE
jgi:hypothetical protein